MGDKCKKEKVIDFANNDGKTKATDRYCRNPKCEVIKRIL